MQYYPPNSYSYFFGRLSTDESEPILRRRGCIDGLFLLREELEEPGSYILSMCFKNKIKHYKFERKKNRNLQIGNSSQFIGPIELINYLQRNDAGLDTRPLIECKRFKGADPVYYLIVDKEGFLDCVEKQIKMRCKGEKTIDARGRLRYVYERFALKELHLSQRWYRKNTNREIAEELFKANGYCDGKFLLRSNKLNKYKLTVCFQNTLHHYRIMFNDGRYYIEGSVGEEFEYLIHLIDFYGREESLKKEKCALNGLLTMPYDVNFSLKQSYFCDTNNNYRAFIADNETIVQADRESLKKEKSARKGLIYTPYDWNFYSRQKQSYFCDTNNNYRAFIADNETIVQADRESLKKEKSARKGLIYTPYDWNFYSRQSYFGDTNSNFYNALKTGRVLEGEISFSELIYKMPTVKFLGKLGEGNFSKVYKALYKPQNAAKEVTVAVKVLKERSDHILYDEAEMMTGFNHENIVKVIEPPDMLDENLRKSVIILEHAEFGPINKYLKENDKLKVPDLLVFVEQIASAMSYIAFHKHVHRDVAARNVFLFKKDLAKISDFGLARKLDDNEYYKIKANVSIPVKWYAPEVLKYKKFTEKSDIWSFGVLLWEIFTFGGSPYALKKFRCKDDLEDFARDIASGKLTLAKPERCPDDVFGLMQRCWIVDQAQRPTFLQLHNDIKSLVSQKPISSLFSLSL